MKLSIILDYYASWGQALFVCGTIPELGSNIEDGAVPMQCKSSAIWSLDIEVDKSAHFCFSYFFLVKENGRTIRREFHLFPHRFSSEEISSDAVSYVVYDSWRDTSLLKVFTSSPFRYSFFSNSAGHKIEGKQTGLLLNVVCPYLRPNEALALCGSSSYLGNWALSNSMVLENVEYGRWQIYLDSSQIQIEDSFKLVIFDVKDRKIVSWELGENRKFLPELLESGSNCVFNLDFRHPHPDNWFGAGVAIPVFSIRTKSDWGIGDFYSLKKMVDWASKTGLRLIQILPVNDSTCCSSWVDSYPYNAISVMALHPIYLNLDGLTLKDAKRLKYFRQKATKLNALESVDYERVYELKKAFVNEYFCDFGADMVASEDFKNFLAKNRRWLFPYACFCYLRDQNDCADYLYWKEFRVYDELALEELVSKDKAMAKDLEKTYWVQFMLHCQLSAARDYAHANGVVLKGDIPIGTNRNSVETWTSPELFKMDTQMGAPPDDFAVTGQNWQFPTYNWDYMQGDDYAWWRERFVDMSRYFDAYRIDHILGFFRIWQIPDDAVQALLGHFAPSLPFSEKELSERGLSFDANRFTKPYITEKLLSKLFGRSASSIIKNYLHPLTDSLYELNENLNTQRKIETEFSGVKDRRGLKVRDALYGLCAEVLFIEDEQKKGFYHPRIDAYKTDIYSLLNTTEKNVFNTLYEDYFYHRHNEFWKLNALKKLPSLLTATTMLACGEDLGMVPGCVPEVMRGMGLLSLELERMPKTMDNGRFGDLKRLPYLSVCTTSTHDMNPIRAWWLEDDDTTQAYYRDVLQKEGNAPQECTVGLCREIIERHLGASSMLVILPIQDWVSMDRKLRKEDFNGERINDPSIAPFYWNYRFHLYIEELLDAKSFTKQVRSMLSASRRIG